MISDRVIHKQKYEKLRVEGENMHTRELSGCVKLSSKLASVYRYPK